MKLELKNLRTLEFTHDTAKSQNPGYKKLKVLYCAICRTDAKMWAQGHRDLTLPRIPGHEIAALDEETGELCTVWPGESCGHCLYCKSGRENLCEEMKILGFHNNGGFSGQIYVPEASIVHVKKDIKPYLLCFTEPVGCVLNGLEKIKIKTGDSVIIYGGGTLGLLIALVCKKKNAVPYIIEKNEEKISRIKKITQCLSIECKKDTVESEFDIAINACSEVPAFSLCLTKLKKGGRMLFFSGLKKNEKIESNIANLIHYKENIISGSYGLVQRNMIDAIDIIQGNEEIIELLIEDFLAPEEAPGRMEDVLSGRPLKYIIDFSPEKTDRPATADKIDSKIPVRSICKISDYINRTLNEIVPVSEKMVASAQHKIDNKTKPLGALGRIEDLAVQISAIQNNLEPGIENKSVFVFASDHGIVEEGVSAFPADVTGEMVENFIKGGAAINVLSRCNNIDLSIIDSGVNNDFGSHPGLIVKKIRKGTRNFALENAMTRDEAIASIESGMDVFFEKYSNSGIDIIGLGEMGIGNTTSATAIICAVIGIPVINAAGRGTGVDDKGMERKVEVIEKALNFHKPDPDDALDILMKIGGFEIGGIAGAALAAASKKTVVVLDGIISTAAGLIAFLINPEVKDYFVSGHKSVEIGQKAALSFMDIEPVIDLNMRLGEGTGAAITISLAECACSVMRDMASFEEAEVSRKIEV